MTFLWGKNSEILFTGWPGTRGGMYALALGVGLAYLVMLAVMSFNGSVLIVAVAGHALGSLVFDSAASQKTPLQSAGGGKGSLPPTACCCFVCEATLELNDRTLVMQNLSPCGGLFFKVSKCDGRTGATSE
ncbi:hypothetical protein C4D60_Mb03t09440 [Musa balbisiana]|uniref:Copper transport protein n=1 Tax=Musa balbisiana TaxID=52838 RepID=A0A4S8JAF7_MUSBA|nr:hypothetical protein C4D60_Mb03t09440 [Musa balbisiana]